MKAKRFSRYLQAGSRWLDRACGYGISFNESLFVWTFLCLKDQWRMATIAMTGASGLIGQAVTRLLQQEGFTVIALRRGRAIPDDARQGCWNPETGEILGKSIQDASALIHLAGENIASRRWDKEQMARIRDSRILPTQKLAQFVVEHLPNIKSVLCASAIGYYGNRGDELLTEASAPGVHGFMPEVCQAWEKALSALTEAGRRVVRLRFGIVLSKKGGALAKMLPPFLLCAGGPLGHGNQLMSWITLDDVARGIIHALKTESLSGHINLVAPNPVSNREFSKALGQALFRPSFAPVPAFAVQLLFGDMAKEVLLSSAKVYPLRLQETGFQFEYPNIDLALRHVLKAS